VARIGGQPARVSALQQQLKRQPPPLPFNLSALQIEAARRFGRSAQQVLDGCQTLYERHQLITYPRSDSRHLPREHHAEAATVLGAIAATEPAFQADVSGADPQVKSKAWNDAKVDAHHALIPTAKRANLGALGPREQQLYRLIARQYLMQFYPDYRYHETRVSIEIAGGCFGARARQPQQLGWKRLEQRSAEADAGRPDAALAAAPEGRREGASEAGARDAEVASLPPLSEGQTLQCLGGRVQDKLTQPPKPFSDATLLAAMTGIARYVTDPAVRQILRDTDGLGTEATRAGIIELLFKRGFLHRQGKQIRSTDAGRGLIDSLPPSATVPDMTAQWEATLEAISRRQARYGDFMATLNAALDGLLAEACHRLPVALQGVSGAKPAPRRRRNGRARRRPPAA